MSSYESDSDLIVWLIGQMKVTAVYTQKEIKDGNGRKDVEPSIEWNYSLMTFFRAAEQSHHSLARAHTIRLATSNWFSIF